MMRTSNAIKHVATRRHNGTIQQVLLVHLSIDVETAAAAAACQLHCYQSELTQ